MRSESVQNQNVQTSDTHRGRRRLVMSCSVAFALLVAVSIAVAPMAASAKPAAKKSPQTLDQKKAQAAKITAEVDKLDMQVADLQEQYNDGVHRLAEIDAHVTKLSNQLKEQEGQFDVAMKHLIDRAVVVYESDVGLSHLMHIAKAKSFNNFLDRMDTIQRVSREDRNIVRRIVDLQKKMQKKRVQLKSARTEKQAQVSAVALSKRVIARKLASREKVLGSVNAEIRSMVAAQQAAAAAASVVQSRSAAELFNTTGTAAPASGAGAGDQGSGSDAGSALAPAAPAAPPASGRAAAAAGIAMRYIGVPYVWGGSSPSGFDCSGLVMYAFAQVGISLPHSSYAQYNAGVHVTRDQLQVGDLIFSEGLGHDGIYVGGGSYVHAPHTGDVVKVSPLPGSYVGATRIS